MRGERRQWSILQTNVAKAAGLANGLHAEMKAITRGGPACRTGNSLSRDTEQIDTEIPRLIICGEN